MRLSWEDIRQYCNRGKYVILIFDSKSYDINYSDYIIYNSGNTILRNDFKRVSGDVTQRINYTEDISLCSYDFFVTDSYDEAKSIFNKVKLVRKIVK
jgi:hypothetical protein